jgi:hypothetical protein
LQEGTTKQSQNVIEIGSLLETKKLGSGVYFVQIHAGDFIATKRLVVEK